MKKIVIGITGSIAAYKTCELISRLKKKNYDISECKKLKIGTVYVGKNVKKLVVKDTVTKYSENDKLKIDKMIVKGKNTVVEGWNKKHLFLGKLYTVSGSKAVKWAKKNKIAYKVFDNN